MPGHRTHVGRLDGAHYLLVVVAIGGAPAHIGLHLVFLGAEGTGNLRFPLCVMLHQILDRQFHLFGGGTFRAHLGEHVLNILEKDFLKFGAGAEVYVGM